MTMKAAILSEALALMLWGICFLLPSASIGADIIYDSLPSKGGVGGIDENTYVVTNKKTNMVTYRPAAKEATRYWRGGNYLEPEVVLSDGVHVSKSLAGLDVSKLIIIVFSPKEIRFVDSNRNYAGTYRRHIDDEPTDEDMNKSP